MSPPIDEHNRRIFNLPGSSSDCPKCSRAMVEQREKIRRCAFCGWTNQRSLNDYRSQYED